MAPPLPPPLSPSASSASTGSDTSPSSRPPSAPPPYCELRRLLVRSSPPPSDPGRKHRAHPQHGAPHPSAADADASLERALLRTWRLLSDPHSGSSRLHLARSFDRKYWRRLALLLFSSNQRLVTAAAAVLEAALYPFPVSLEHIRITPGTEAHLADQSDPHRQLRTVWSALRSSAQALDSACDKLEDCAALLAALPENNQGIRPTVSSADDQTVAVAARLVHVVGAAVASDTSDARTLALLHDLSKPEPSQPALPALLYVQLTALRELSTLQRLQIQNSIRATVEAESILPAPLLLLYLDQLVEASRTVSASNVTHVRAVDSLSIQCYCLYLDLLTGAAPYQHSLPAVDTVLVICDALLIASDDSLQHAALRWLYALLDTDSTPPSLPSHRVGYAEALARAIRLSGALRTLSWLLMRLERSVREQAAAVLSLVERRSPPADLTRALIEQGCVAIYRVVVEQQHHSPDRDPGSEMAAHLIRWTRRELGELRPFLVRACCHAVRHSTNAALRVNVVLALHILRSGEAGRADSEGESSCPSAVNGIRTALQTENFVDDVLLRAIEDGEHDDGADGSFARALLAVLANTCDPLSLLKLERGASRRSSSNVLHGTEASIVDRKSSNSSTLTICCADGASVAADLDLLEANSARVRRYCDTIGHEARALNTSMAAVEVSADAVKLVVKLLSPPSTALLASEDDAGLLDALEAARVLETPAAWHLAARTLPDRLSTSNWADLALGALRVRHPALASRAASHGINSSSSSDADLVRVAAAMSREFFRDW